MRGAATRIMAMAATLVLASAITYADEPTRPDRNCYEGIGCPYKEDISLIQLRALSCENLAHVRNHLYYEHFLCFDGEAAKAAYGNSGCKYQATRDVPLTPLETANVARIRHVEVQKHCR